VNSILKKKYLYKDLAMALKMATNLHLISFLRVLKFVKNFDASGSASARKTEWDLSQHNLSHLL
jgi:hypothetical protein